jgi:L-glyceraldehyde 3-phosphate reductase
MGLAYVDIFYHHRPDPETPLEETMGALDQAVRSGKALYAGISNYPPDRTAEAAAILRKQGTPFLIHQFAYSMFRREPEDGLLQTLTDQGIGGIAFSPLAQGLLTDRYLDGIPADSRAARPRAFLRPKDIDEKRVSKARALHEMARGRGQTLAQMALAWVLRNDSVTSVLIGTSRPEQVDQDVATLHRLDFSQEELRHIESILAG